MSHSPLQSPILTSFSSRMKVGSDCCRKFWPRTTLTSTQRRKQFALEKHTPLAVRVREGRARGARRSQSSTAWANRGHTSKHSRRRASPWRLTGGSCKKSPHSTSCMPPKGFSLPLRHSRAHPACHVSDLLLISQLMTGRVTHRTALATASSLSTNSASSMLTSSITSTLVVRQRRRLCGRDARLIRLLRVPSPLPMPAKE